MPDKWIDRIAISVVLAAGAAWLVLFVAFILDPVRSSDLMMGLFDWLVP